MADGRRTVFKPLYDIANGVYLLPESAKPLNAFDRNDYDVWLEVGFVVCDKPYGVMLDVTPYKPSEVIVVCEGGWI